ncbi:MAG: DUF2231 domain-containing protein [Rhodomicrobiaceae bacterium]
MSFEILPNWHPFFVHFTIALISVGSVLYIVSNSFPTHSRWGKDILLVSVWSLVLAGAFTVLTLIAGLHAYLTVAHDGSSHMAMTDHRNWGFGTGVLLFISLCCLKFFSPHIAARLFTSFIFILLLSSVLITGYKGSHLVYKFGLGVQSLPTSLQGHDDHHHDKEKKKNENSDHSHNHDGHSH